jgi:hypothetical protein
MNTEQMRIRMGEMAAEVERLTTENARLKTELKATDISGQNALAVIDEAKAAEKELCFA